MDQEYQTRSPVGYENMAWKDSGDAVMYPDGSLVKGPKALCELQGYNAWVRMAEAFEALGKPDRAQELRAKAATLFERFNESFWDEELDFYVYALDGGKNKVKTIASNAGHCLWSGIVPRERTKKVAPRIGATAHHRLPFCRWPIPIRPNVWIALRDSRPAIAPAQT